MTHLKQFIKCVGTLLQYFIVCASAHSVISHKMCGLHDLRSSPCQPLPCSVWWMREPESLLWNPGLQLRLPDVHLTTGQRGEWRELHVRQAEIVSDRKLSKEWSCSVSVTSTSSAQPSSPHSTAIYKIPLWPSLRQGWMPILESTICSSVRIFEVPRDYATALQAWLLSNAVLRADDNTAANQLSDNTKAGF